MIDMIIKLSLASNRLAKVVYNRMIRGWREIVIRMIFIAAAGYCS